MANMLSNRSPSPLSSRSYRNSGTNSTTRGSFNGSPFARPNALMNPKSSNSPTHANTPTSTDHTKRTSINRKSMSSLFQDGKENQKDALRSPAKMGSKNFMAPTISAASKFTPSPRKKILGDKNDVTRASIQFLDKDSDFKSESITFDQTSKTNDDDLNESKTVEEKEIVFENPAVRQVILSSTDESIDMISSCTEDSDMVSIRPFSCSTIASPIVAPLDSDSHLPPYDPKKNFLSPRPRFLRYKPNPRIENFLNRDGSDDYGEDDVTRLEGSFNLSENSDTEVEEQEKESELGDSVHESLDDLSENVSEEKQVDSKVEKASKTRFFTGSKIISLVFLMFLVTCYSVSFTDFPPMDLPIYKDVGFSEIYHESLKLAGFAKESFDVLVENLKNWSIDFVSYISHLKSQLFLTHKTTPITFFNLTNSPVQEEFVFNRHIGTDYIQVIQEYDEEIQDYEENMRDDEEEDFAEMEVDVDIDVADEVMNEQSNEIQSDDDGFVETKSNLEDGSVSKSESMYEALLETEANDLETESDVADSSDESEILSSLPTKSLDRICLAGFSMVIVAVCAIFYMNKRKSNAKTLATMRVADDTTHEESCSSSIGNEHKKKTSNKKRESLAFSSSDYSMGSSYGSFTTLERIPIKKKDEVILTPIRRSSRLLKNQVP